MSDDEGKEEKELDLSSPDVVTKYKSTTEIANSINLSFPLKISFKMVFLNWFLMLVFYLGTEALQLVLSECKPKAKIVDICEKGDAFIRE